MKFSIIVFLVVFLYWHLGFSARIWLGFFLGFLVDSVSAFPFGVYSFIFILATILVEILRNLFSNTDSWFTKGIAVASVFFVANSLIYPTSYVLAKLQRSFIPWDLRLWFDIIIWSLVPAIVLILSFSIIHSAYEGKKK